MSVVWLALQINKFQKSYGGVQEAIWFCACLPVFVLTSTRQTLGKKSYYWCLAENPSVPSTEFEAWPALFWRRKVHQKNGRLKAARSADVDSSTFMSDSKWSAPSAAVFWFCKISMFISVAVRSALSAGFISMSVLRKPLTNLSQIGQPPPQKNGDFWGGRHFFQNELCKIVLAKMF